MASGERGHGDEYGFETLTESRRGDAAIAAARRMHGVARPEEGWHIVFSEVAKPLREDIFAVAAFDPEPPHIVSVAYHVRITCASAASA